MNYTVCNTFPTHEAKAIAWWVDFWPTVGSVTMSSFSGYRIDYGTSNIQRCELDTSNGGGSGGSFKKNMTILWI